MVEAQPKTAASLARQTLLVAAFLAGLMIASTPASAMLWSPPAIVVTCDAGTGGVSCSVCSGTTEFRVTPTADRDGVIVYVPHDSELDESNRVGYHKDCTSSGGRS